MVININPNLFINPNTKEVCYFLGFLWADGYLGKGITSQHGKNYRITLGIIKPDFQNIEPILDKIGKWNKFFRQQPNRQPQGEFITSNMAIHKFLIENNYGNKNMGPKILDIIPTNLLKYWYRGYLDGDGNIYCTYNKYLVIQVSFSAPYEQNWTFMEKLINRLHINKFGIQRLVRLNGNSHSTFRVTNLIDSKKLLDFIYQDFDNIGLIRKYNKYQLFNSFFNLKVNKT